MAFPIKVICFISGLQTHLGLLSSELSKSRGPSRPLSRRKPAWTRHRLAPSAHNKPGGPGRRGVASPFVGSALH